MKINLFSYHLTAASLITAGLTLTTHAKLLAHGHQYGHVLGRIVHKQTASSGSSLNNKPLGAADRKPHLTVRAGFEY